MTGHSNARENAGRAATYALFALTGVGLVLPGTLLPLLVSYWQGNDARSGALFFVFFFGTSLGAFCARGTLSRMLGLATVAFALPVAVLHQVRGTLIFGALATMGFSLGVQMTAVTLLHSRRQPADRMRELVRLNLLWAVGACAGPPLLLRAVARAGMDGTLHGFAALALPLGFVVSWLLQDEPVPPSGAWRAWRQMRQLPLKFAVALPLSTGIEAGLGGWLTTYTLREQQGSVTMVSAITALWAGLLLSRLVFSGRRISLRAQRWVLPAFALLLVCGMLLLLCVRASAGAIGGAVCIGFGIGPLYPYLLSQLLDTSEAGNAGFLAAGAGSALLPLLIGQVAQYSHSLRMGLLIPTAGGMVLLVILFRGIQQRSVD